MHALPVGERFPVFLEVEVQVAQAGERVGIAGVDLQDLVVDLLGAVEVQDLAVRVRDAREHGHVAVALREVLLPDLDGPVELLQGTVAVSKPDQRILVAHVVAEAFLVVADGLVVGLALARRVPHADKGVIVLRLDLQDAAEVLLRLCDMIFLEELVAPLGELGYRYLNRFRHFVLTAHVVPAFFPSDSHCFITFAILLDQDSRFFRTGCEPVRPKCFQRLPAVRVPVSDPDQTVRIFCCNEDSLRETEIPLVEKLVALANERGPLLFADPRAFFLCCLEKSARGQLFQDVLRAHELTTFPTISRYLFPRRE